MSNTIPLPPHVGEEYHGPSQSPVKLYDADQLHAHAAAVSAAKDAEIAGLREYLDAAQRRGEELRAQVAGLRKALAAAIRQNEHDMLMTGEELRAAFTAALGDKTPPPSPSPRS